MEQRREHEADEPHVVVERQPRDADVALVHVQAVVRDALHVRHEVRVREHHAFRFARRSGCVDENG